MNALPIPMVWAWLLVAGTATAWAAAEPLAGQVTLPNLLEQMCDRTAVARWPHPLFVLKQFSSYDRSSTNPAVAASWYANNDAEQFLRIEQNAGRREWVIMDHDGPGAITRMWLPLEPSRDQQTIRFYLDGSPTPAIAVKFNELMSGRDFVRSPFAFVAWNETDLRRQRSSVPSTLRGVAGDCYLPIPFARSCKVTLDQVPFYYIINYRAYEPGTPVESFSMARWEAAQPVVARTGDMLLAEPKSARLPTMHRATLGPGQELAIPLPRGPSSVREVRVRVDPASAPQVLRSVVLTGEFDGTPTIWCPLGEFFGAGARLRAVRDWYRTVSENGLLAARWVMPYQHSGRLAVRNLGQETVVVELGAAQATWRWDDRSMLFHANWRGQAAIPTRPMSDWNYLEAQGQGVYVGDTLTAFNPVASWYGEGDEHVYLDGETFPSHNGTGTEDYYGYAWGMATFFQSPWISAPQRDVKTRESWRGYTTTSRVRLLDGMPYRRSLKLDMEIWHWSETKVDYAAGLFWYARPGATHNRPPQPEMAARTLTELPKPFEIEGGMEAEQMRVVGHSAGLKWSRQDHYEFEDGNWSGDAQLFVQAKERGDFLELEVAENLVGLHRLVLYATRSFDYGVLRFTVNGQAVEKTFDMYATKPALSGPIDLGVFMPKEGKLVLRVEVIGENSAAKAPGHFFGLDGVAVQAP